MTQYHIHCSRCGQPLPASHMYNTVVHAEHVHPQHNQQQMPCHSCKLVHQHTANAQPIKKKRVSLVRGKTTIVQGIARIQMHPSPLFWSGTSEAATPPRQKPPRPPHQGRVNTAFPPFISLPARHELSWPLLPQCCCSLVHSTHYQLLLCSVAAPVGLAE